jgi:signal peptidase I
MLHTRFSQGMRSAFSLAIMIAVWLAFAPTQVGGVASYVIVIGNSMEPGFHRGDLVIAHHEPVYRSGDAVVYRNQELQNFVFHRIISKQLGHFTLKGDNNAWVDTYQPTAEEIVGKLWLHIPRGGYVIQTVRSPFIMALLAGALGTVLTAGMFAGRTKGRRTMNKVSPQQRFISSKKRSEFAAAEVKRQASQESLSFNRGEIFEGSFFVLGLIALSALILGILAFSRPTTRLSENEISYDHLGVFAYSASAPQGVYDANSIKSGDPIFTKLTCSVTINFQYALLAAGAENIQGTYQLTAIVLEQASGWQRKLPLQDEQSFSGTGFGTTAHLDLCQMQSLTTVLEQETDFHPGMYTLIITPNIKVAGAISDQPLETSFTPTLTFRYDQLQFFLVRNEAQENPFAVTETGILRTATEEGNTLLLLGKEFPISMLRAIAMYFLLISVGGLLLLGLKLRALSEHDSVRFFRLKHGSLIVDVQNIDSPAASNIIEVTSMDALAKLAERFNTMILHRDLREFHAYYVQTGGVTYRFVLGVNEGAPATPESMPLPVGQERDL